MSQHARYLGVLLLCSLLLGTGVALLNYCVDPYGIFGSRCSPDLTARKPAAADRVRVMKPYLADRAVARTVIGGNSRPEMGLNPGSACWREIHYPVFNAGVPGASFSLQTLMAMHAAQFGARQILHGVDFVDFIERVPRAPPATSRPRSVDERRLAVAGVLPADHEFLVQRAKDKAQALLSLAALNDSVYTVGSQRNLNVSTREQNGFNPGRDYLPIIRAEGQQVLFELKTAELRHRLEANHRLQPLEGSTDLSFVALRRIAAWSRERGIELTLFINPYHRDYLQVIADTGLWPLFEAWKRALLEVASKEQISVWDFTGMHPFLEEPIPTVGDKRTMLRWFWEPAHYRSELGDLMLARMLEADCGQPDPYRSHFGVQLNNAIQRSQFEQLPSVASIPNRKSADTSAAPSSVPRN